MSMTCIDDELKTSLINSHIISFRKDLCKLIKELQTKFDYNEQPFMKTAHDIVVEKSLKKFDLDCALNVIERINGFYDKLQHEEYFNSYVVVKLVSCSTHLDIIQRLIHGEDSDE